MAGVGFQLNKLRHDSYAGLVKAYAYAAFIGNGAWLVAVISLAALGALLSGLAHLPDIRPLFVSISVVFGITLVLTGPIQTVLTRYAADQFFLNQQERIFPAFAYLLSWNSALFGLLGTVLFVGFVPGPLLFRLSAALLMVLVANIWVATIFLTAIKRFARVVLSFLLGFLSSLAAAPVLAHSYGLSGAMLGFVMGQALLLFLLCAAVYREMGSTGFEPGELPRHFLTYWDLALAGFLYNFGVWIDKFLFWWLDPLAEPVGGLLHASPVYDRVVYFAFLAIVPGMAVFLFKLETEFAPHSHAFIQHVLRKGTFSQIATHQKAMIAALREGFSLLLKVQGLITASLILATPYILRWLGLGHVQAGVLQVTLIGTFLLVVLLSLLMILHYLDRRREALICCAAFALTNAALTAWTIQMGDQWFGVGFMVAAGVGVLMATPWVNLHLARLDYHTFAAQSIQQTDPDLLDRGAKGDLRATRISNR